MGCPLLQVCVVTIFSVKSILTHGGFISPTSLPSRFSVVTCCLNFCTYGIKGVIYLFMSISLIHLTSVFPYMEWTGQVILHGLKELLDNIGMWPGDRAAYFIWTLGWYLAITTISYTEWQQTVSGGHLGLNGSTGVLTVLSQPEEENSFLVQAGVTCKAQGWSRYTKLTARLRKSDIKHCVASVENEQQAWLIQTWLSCYTNRQEALYILQPSWRYLTT